MDPLELLARLTPAAPDWTPDWKAILDSPLGTLCARMADIPQNPRFHGEGDVWTHTQMVCGELCKLEGFRTLPELDRMELFIGALLHDIGKIPATRMEDGNWTSPNHGLLGSLMARELLWQDLDLAGTEERQAVRETICSYIRRHGLPHHILEHKRGEWKLRSSAEIGRLVPRFTLEKLYLLSEADAKGRIAEELEGMLETFHLAVLLTEESGCLQGPYSFASEHTRAVYLSGKEVSPEVPLYDSSWGTVTMLAGLSGTGKDTWIAQNCPGLPVVSLDDIRRELHASPREDQGRVAQLGRERAKALLRAHQPFVWNATDITLHIREKLVRLFRDYGARVCIVYLETPLEENFRRNKMRRYTVPQQVILNQLHRLEPPSPEEADAVEWHCI